MNTLAQNLGLPGGGSVTGPLTNTPNIGSLLSRAMPIVIGLAGLALLLMLITAGYSYMTSGGDAKKLEQGKQRLTNAILGFIIIFGAYWLVQIVGIMFGTTITSGFK